MDLDLELRDSHCSPGNHTYMYVSFQDDGQVHNLLTLYPDFTSLLPLFVCFMDWVNRGYLLINLSNTYILTSNTLPGQSIRAGVPRKN